MLFTATTEWLHMLGVDIRSLAPDISYTGEIRPQHHHDNNQLLPVSSAFECTFLRDMDSLLTMSIVPKSKVSPLLTETEIKPAPKSFLLGRGIKMSVINQIAVVTISPQTPNWAKKFAEVLLNKTQVVDIRYNIQGRDIHYLVKPDASKADDELASLGIHTDEKVLYDNITISVKRLPHSDARLRIGQNHEVDVRIKGEYSVINIRYGTTLDREKQRIINHAKQRAIEHAWEREKWTLQNGLTTQNRWNDRERQQILTGGYADGYEGHYINSAQTAPELSDDCNNIRFTKRNR